MLQINTDGTVFIVTENSAQTQLFTSYLTEHTHCNIRVQKPYSQFTDLPSHPILIVIDSDHISVEDLHSWYETLPDKMAETPIAALNVRDLEQALKLLREFNSQVQHSTMLPDVVLQIQRVAA